MDSGLSDQCVTIGLALAFIANLHRRLRVHPDSVLTLYLSALSGGGFAPGGAAAASKIELCFWASHSSRCAHSASGR